MADIHNYMCHICAKGFLDSNINQEVINKISNFHEIAPNFIQLLSNLIILHPVTAFVLFQTTEPYEL